METPKTKKILISEIELNRARQPRVGMNKDYVSELHASLESGETLPAIKVFSERGVAPFFLSDGWHRLEANLAIGFREVEAEIIIGTAFDAFKNSLGENDSHGLRRTTEDKKRAVSLAFEDEELKGLTDRAIAEICRVGHPFVAKLRPSTGTDSSSAGGTDSTSNGDEPKRKGKDGKSYSGKTNGSKSKKGKSNSKSKAKPEAEILDGNGIVVPAELVGSWNDTQATVMDLQMHAHVLLDKWPEKLFGVQSQRIRESLNTLLRSLDVVLCPECKGAKCKECNKRGIISKRPLLGTGK